MARFAAAKLTKQKITESVGNELVKEFRYSGIASAQESNPCGCNGDCFYLCNCTKTRVIAAMRAAAPSCCNGGVPDNNLFCPSFNINVASTDKTYTMWIQGC